MENQLKSVDVGFVDDLRVILKYTEASLDADVIVFKVRKAPHDASDVRIHDEYNVSVVVKLQGSLMDRIHEITFPVDVCKVVFICGKGAIKCFDDGPVRRITFPSPVMMYQKLDNQHDYAKHKIKLMYNIDPAQFKEGKLEIDADDCMSYGMASPTLSCDCRIDRAERPRATLEELVDQISSAKAFHTLKH